MFYRFLYHFDKYTELIKTEILYIEMITRDLEKEKLEYIYICIIRDFSYSLYREYTVTIL